MKWLLILAVVSVALLTGCRTNDVTDKSIAYYKDGKLDRVERNYRDKSHGVPEWSNGVGKNLPFSNVTVSGVNVGK